MTFTKSLVAYAICSISVQVHEDDFEIKSESEVHIERVTHPEILEWGPHSMPSFGRGRGRRWETLPFRSNPSFQLSNLQSHQTLHWQACKRTSAEAQIWRRQNRTSPAVRNTSNKIESEEFFFLKPFPSPRFGRLVFCAFLSSSFFPQVTPVSGSLPQMVCELLT